MCEPTQEAPSTAGLSEVVMEASLSHVLVGEFQDDQDSAPEEPVCPRENRTECLGAFCRGRGMARAGALQRRLCVGVLKSWAGPEFVREEGGSRREQCTYT